MYVYLYMHIYSHKELYTYVHNSFFKNIYNTPQTRNNMNDHQQGTDKQIVVYIIQEFKKKNQLIHTT